MYFAHWNILARPNLEIDINIITSSSLSPCVCFIAMGQKKHTSHSGFLTIFVIRPVVQTRPNYIVGFNVPADLVNINVKVPMPIDIACKTRLPTFRRRYFEIICLHGNNQFRLKFVPKDQSNYIMPNRAQAIKCTNCTSVHCWLIASLVDDA